MIIVEMTGGLGNQLFQYAFYLYQKKTNMGREIRILKCIHHEHNGYELESVFENISLPVIGFFRFFLWRIVKRVFGLFPAYSKDKMDLQYILRGIGEYDLGCWQRLCYINRVEEELCQTLQFPPFLDEKNSRFSEHLLSTDCTVALHVRRGDYLGHKQLLSLGDTIYYREAIQYMRDQLGNPVFIVFSDDIDWCKESLPLDATSCYVDWNRGMNSFRDMQLMSLCKHMIMANSTFSWWGAWLNFNPDKIIVTPKRWFLSFSTSTVIDIPENWIRL